MVMFYSSDILRRCIVEQVANMMVLPNKLPIKLSDEIPTVDLRMPEPEGVLRIHLVRGENLMKKDVSMLGMILFRLDLYFYISPLK